MTPALTLHPLTFTNCAGDVVWNGRTRLSDEQVKQLLGTLWKEYMAAVFTGDRRATVRAYELKYELLAANSQALRWRQCAGKPSLAASPRQSILASKSANPITVNTGAD